MRPISALLATGAVLVPSACSAATAGVRTGDLDAAASGNGKGVVTAAPAVPTTEAPITAWPLTGLPIADPAQARHSVVAVKIDNSPPARPQTGLTQADDCIEERVEGITRLMCLFHSEDADPVGPIRSARSSDVDLMGNLSRPVLMWSGGNAGVTAEIDWAVSQGFIIEAGHPRNDSLYHRDNRRQMPHNLYGSTAPVREQFTPGPQPAPHPLFAYRAPGEALPPSAADTPGFVVDFGRGVRAEYVWDQERKGWDRFQVDESHPRGRSAFMDSNGRQVAPDNVVILVVPYGQSDADSRSPKAVSVGEGDAIVLTDGKAVVGRWKRPVSFASWELVDPAGAPIRLTPGRTWVALPEAGGPAPVPLDPATAASLLGERR